MQTYAEPFSLLCHKKDLFFQLELLTEHMCLQDVDALVDTMEKRTIIFKEIESLDILIKTFTNDDHKLRQALNHEFPKNTFDTELAMLYDLSLSIKACINRINQNDDHILLHMDFEKQLILGKIEKLNTSGAVAANKYHRSTPSRSNNPFHNGKTKWI